MKKIVSCLVVAMFTLGGSAVMAADYKAPKLPDAPAEYQKMKNKKKGKKAVEAGQKTFKRKCKKCHGMEGDGMGSAADDLGYAATAFSKKGYLKGRSDGQLFFIIKEGSKGTDMEAFGPGSDVNLSEDEIWEVIAFMRDEFQK